MIEFMSDHSLNTPGGCFYHHCADLKIQSAPVSSTTDGGGQVIGGSGGGVALDPMRGIADGGLGFEFRSACGCSTPGGRSADRHGLRGDDLRAAARTRASWAVNVDERSSCTLQLL